MPGKLNMIIAYGIGHMEGCNGNSILGICKFFPSHTMFRAKTTGREKEIFEVDGRGKNVGK